MYRAAGVGGWFGTSRVQPLVLRFGPLEYISPSAPHFRSFTFHGDAPKAYQIESEFKGAGCTIRFREDISELRKIREELQEHTTDTAPPDFIDERLLVESFYLRLDRGRQEVFSSVDFRYSNDELSPHRNSASPVIFHIFDQVVNSCYEGLSQSRIVGSYFLPILVSAIRSCDLSKLDYDPISGWKNAPYVFEEIISGGVSSVLKTMPGLNLLLLATWDHAFSQKSGNVPDAVQSEILRRLSTVPSCFRNLDQVPSFVISEKARHKLVKLRATWDREVANQKAQERLARAQRQKDKSAST